MKDYFMGFQIEYTGKTEMLHGKLAYEFRYIEGDKAGTIGWFYRAPGE